MLVEPRGTDRLHTVSFFGLVNVDMDVTVYSPVLHRRCRRQNFSGQA